MVPAEVIVKTAAPDVPPPGVGLATGMVAVPAGNGHTAVSVDTTGCRPGRGAWLHPVDRCLSAAIRRHAFGRALRITGTPDTSAVVEHFAGLIHPGKRTGSEEHEHTVKSR